MLEALAVVFVAVVVVGPVKVEKAFEVVEEQGSEDGQDRVAVVVVLVQRQVVAEVEKRVVVENGMEVGAGGKEVEVDVEVNALGEVVAVVKMEEVAVAVWMPEGVVADAMVVVAAAHPRTTVEVA